MHKPVFILLALQFLTLSLSPVGGNRDFWITTENDYRSRIVGNKDITFKRCLIVPVFDKNTKDIDKTTDESALLAKFAYLLSSNQFYKMEDYLKKCDNT